MSCLVWTGCGKPDPAQRYLRPIDITDFPTLFAKNCSGCHGINGQFGPGPPLNDPLFYGIVTDRQIAGVIQRGRAGTLMPAFEREFGGPLSAEQVRILVAGLRLRWGRALPERLSNPPTYQVTPDDPAGLEHADAAAGKALFDVVCARCHGVGGAGGDAGPLRVDALAELVSDQLLRRIIITGRGDLEMPNYVDNGTESALGAPLTAQEIINIAGYVRSLQRERPAANEITSHVPKGPPDD